MKDYKKILEGIVNIINTTEKSDIGFANICSYIGENCPELAENEDEKIRKDVKRAISVALDYSYFDKETANNCLTWLDKKAGKDKLIQELGKYKVKYTQEILSQQLEKQGEQKLADKVEPKFNVGDWVIFKDKSVYKVKSIHNYEYTLQHILGGTMPLPFSSKNLIRPWTIQDAKDGEVLSFNDGHGDDCIELIKSITDKKIEFWFCLTNSNRYEVFDGNLPYTNLASRKDATPATKEQRDLLFQKIHDAGYEWNKEKKELRKIENFPILSNSVKTGKNWSEEDEKCIDNCCLLIGAADNCYEKTFKDDCIHYLQSLKERIAWKPMWTEEDSSMQLTLMRDIEQVSFISKEGKDERIMWLNKLDDRFHQNTNDIQKSKWSEEDEGMMNHCIGAIHIAGKQVCNSYTAKDKEQMKKWLKSLKQRMGGEK